MLNFARIVFFLFSALLIVGGIAGFVEKRSIPSLLSGLVCGGAGLYAALILPARPSLALGIGLTAALLAGGGILPRLRNKETGEIKMWPAGTVVAVSVLTAIVAGVGLATSRSATPPGASDSTGR